MAFFLGVGGGGGGGIRAALRRRRFFNDARCCRRGREESEGEEEDRRNNISGWCQTRKRARPTSQGPGFNNHRLSRPLSASIEHIKSANLELSEFCAVRSLPLPPLAVCPKTARDGGKKQSPPFLSIGEGVKKSVRENWLCHRNGYSRIAFFPVFGIPMNAAAASALSE